MALGMKSRKVDNNTQDITVNNGLTTHTEEKTGYGYDPESNEKGGRKMSRIAAARGDSDSDSTLSVGKQLELEATNSIKYRTCSWQKVI